MVTFTIICIMLAVALAFALTGITIVGVIFSGVALVLADIVVGVLPFYLAFKLIKWLFRKKERSTTVTGA